MNRANHVVVLRIERTEPVHISQVISELLSELTRRSEPAAGRVELFANGVAERHGLAEKARQPCV